MSCSGANIPKIKSKSSGFTGLDRNFNLMGPCLYLAIAGNINELDCFMVILEFQDFCIILVKYADLSGFARVTALAKNKHSHLVIIIKGFSTKFLENRQNILYVYVY